MGPPTPRATRGRRSPSLVWVDAGDARGPRGAVEEGAGVAPPGKATIREPRSRTERAARTRGPRCELSGGDSDLN